MYFTAESAATVVALYSQILSRLRFLMP